MTVYKADITAADRVLKAAVREAVSLIRQGARLSDVRVPLEDAMNAAGLLIDGGAS